MPAHRHGAAATSAICKDQPGAKCWMFVPDLQQWAGFAVAVVDPGPRHHHAIHGCAMHAIHNIPPK